MKVYIPQQGLVKLRVREQVRMYREERGARLLQASVYRCHWRSRRRAGPAGQLLPEGPQWSPCHQLQHAFGPEAVRAVKSVSVPPKEKLAKGCRPGACAGAPQAQRCTNKERGGSRASWQRLVLASSSGCWTLTAVQEAEGAGGLTRQQGSRQHSRLMPGLEQHARRAAPQPSAAWLTRQLAPAAD